MTEIRAITVNSSRKIQLIDISREVEDFASSYTQGVAFIFCPHSTAGILINEPEKGLVEDFEKIFDQILPQSENYKHNLIDNNARAHLVSGLIGSSAIVPVDDGRLILGTWQAIFFVELDGPRTRKVICKIIEG